MNTTTVNSAVPWCLPQYDRLGWILIACVSIMCLQTTAKTIFQTLHLHTRIILGNDNNIKLHEWQLLVARDADGL